MRKHEIECKCGMKHQLITEMNSLDGYKKKDFNAWLKTHGCDKEQLWYLQNMLGDCYGDDNHKQAVIAWNASQKKHDTSDPVHAAFGKCFGYQPNNEPVPEDSIFGNFDTLVSPGFTTAPLGIIPAMDKPKGKKLSRKLRRVKRILLEMKGVGSRPAPSDWVDSVFKHTESMHALIVEALKELE